MPPIEMEGPFGLALSTCSPCSPCSWRHSCVLRLGMHRQFWFWSFPAHESGALSWRGVAATAADALTMAAARVGSAPARAVRSWQSTASCRGRIRARRLRMGPAATEYWPTGSQLCRAGGRAWRMRTSCCPTSTPPAPSRSSASSTDTAAAPWPASWPSGCRGYCGGWRATGTAATRRRCSRCACRWTNFWMVRLAGASCG
mmetsp:Transcript_20471/g.70859  ORF Transcript_20471/g.70859 Transcript_20471/m.70859 type:complete len:201 (+) Transcript_20471:24-626(+)